MNDYNNWFYKLCKKQCAKDLGISALGIGLILLGVWMFTASVGVLAVLFLFVVGGFLIYWGLKACYKWLPDVRSYLQSMQPAEYTELSREIPPCMYGTFYFTNGFLCVPSAYAMIRYNEIGNISTQKVYHRKYGQNGVCVSFEFMDGRMPIRVNVKDWRMFENDMNNFYMLVQQHKQIGTQY